MMPEVEKVIPVVSLGELKAYLRIEDEREDALLAGWLRAATEVVERECGQLLIIRAVTEEFPFAGTAVRLSQRPVVHIESVEIRHEDGEWESVGTGDYDAQLLADGSVSLIARSLGGRALRVGYQAGMATDANGVPEFIRQMVIRVAAHWHAYRDAADARALPEAVHQMLAGMKMPRFRALGA